MAKQHKSNRGQAVDMNKLILRHNGDIAVGNARQNARGDTIGQGGKVIKSVEEAARDYYKKTGPKQTKNVSIKADPLTKQDEDDWDEATAAPEVKEENPAPKKSSKRKVKSVMNEDIVTAVTKKQEEDDWVEDEEGNFVKASDTKEDKE